MPKTGATCYYCGEKTVVIGGPLAVWSPMAETRDHVVPLVLGGAKTGANVVVACGWCNARKADLLHHEWVAGLAFVELEKRDGVFRRKAAKVLARWPEMVPKVER